MLLVTKILTQNHILSRYKMNPIDVYTQIENLTNEIRKLENAREPYLEQVRQINEKFSEENKPNHLLGKEFVLKYYEPHNDSIYYEGEPTFYGRYDPKDIKKYLDDGFLIAKKCLLRGIKKTLIGKTAKVEYIYLKGTNMNQEKTHIEVCWRLTIRFKNKDGEWSREHYYYNYVDLVPV